MANPYRINYLDRAGTVLATRTFKDRDAAYTALDTAKSAVDGDRAPGGACTVELTGDATVHTHTATVFPNEPLAPPTYPLTDEEQGTPQ